MTKKSNMYKNVQNNTKKLSISLSFDLNFLN